MAFQAIQVKDISQIELDRHAVIEASAGTGKTYCIENLVVRLLCEKEIPLDKILLVTFTEKATGDLHSRIRANIIQALNDGKGRRSFLQEALENFDTASIFTIHGFCQRMLRQYTFENGGNFNLEMVADNLLYPTLLREQQRDEWPELYGDNLELLLRLSGYPGTIDNDGVSSWESRVLELAKRFSPYAGDSLLPDCVSAGGMDEMDAVVSAMADKVQAIIGVGDEGVEPQLLGDFQSLPIHKSTMAACLNKVLVPLTRFLRRHLEHTTCSVEFKELIDQCSAYKRFAEDGFSSLVSGVYENKITPETQIIVDQVSELAELLDTAVEESGVVGIKELLSARTIARLREQAMAYKNEHGLMSFDDMLTMMADSLNPARNPTG